MNKDKIETNDNEENIKKMNSNKGQEDDTKAATSDTNSGDGLKSSSGDSEKPKKVVTEVLCENGEKFRMRLIRHFQLLDNLNEMEIILETPKYHPTDLLDAATRIDLLKHNPYALVKFSAIKKRVGALTKQERRQRRLLCRENIYPPLDLWANWIVDSSWFQNLVLFVIITNAILLVIEQEFGSDVDNCVFARRATQAIRTLDVCCLWVFLLEIVLKWMDDFKLFWKNGWNKLDFIVTVVSVLPEVLKFFANNSYLNIGSSSTWIATLGFLRILRIIRLLKIVSRLEQARIILLAVSKAFSAMSFILLLLALFMWIFALMGQVIFVRYTGYDGRAEGIWLHYQKAFSDIFWSFATLFQLMTLDHWLATLYDILQVMTGAYEATITIVFILAWVWIGSFVFKNIFAGIMVNNFQTIRNDLHWEKKEKEAKLEVDKFKKELTEGAVNEGPIIEMELVKTPEIASGNEEAVEERKDGDTSIEPFVKLSAQALKTQSALSLVSLFSSATAQKEYSSRERIKKAKWDNMVQRHLEFSQKMPGEVLWTRDVLFRYFQNMEQMQENLRERHEIIKLLNFAVLQMHEQ